MPNTTGLTEYILAVLTTDKTFIGGGGCHIFYLENNEQLQQKALLISKCVGGMVHGISEETLIVVKH